MEGNYIYPPIDTYCIAEGDYMVLFSGISKMSAGETIALINALSVALSDGLSNEDINALGNLVVAVGSVILTIGALVDKQPDTDETDKITVKK
jgi:hypothetical protein